MEWHYSDAGPFWKVFPEREGQLYIDKVVFTGMIDAVAV